MNNRKPCKNEHCSSSTSTGRADKDKNYLLPILHPNPKTSLTRISNPARVIARLAIQPMQGLAQAHLMMDTTGSMWVVKFTNNTQHLRVLANEYVASRVAAMLDLSVADSALIDVGEWLVNSSPHLSIILGRGNSQRCAPGIQYGSRYAGGLMPGQVVDLLPERDLLSIRNLDEFAGILAFDKWMCNCDRRQAVFVRNARQRRYRAVFIDHGFCFNAGEWSFPDHPLRGLYRQHSVYKQVTSWNSFEPWLNRIEEFRLEDLIEIIDQVPHEWHGATKSCTEYLAQKLYQRRLLVRDLIGQTHRSTRNPFSNWRVRKSVAIPPKSRFLFKVQEREPSHQVLIN